MFDETDRNEISCTTVDIYISIKSDRNWYVRITVGIGKIFNKDRNRLINTMIDGKESSIHGNKEMIKELIENLVQNAIRYNNPGGKVWVSVNTIDNSPCLIVKDNGIGIPAADQQRVFERFYRVDKSKSKATGGTGLGLAIVKHIVENHDAKIELDSARE